MNDTLIEAQGLTKRYGGTLAVDDISFQVGRGEIFGLLGPNGAGKTTTILMLLGLTDTSAGTVRVMGRDPQRDPLGVKRQLGYLPDAVGFYDYLSARDNLAYTARLLGLDAGERASRIDRALARMRLSEVSERRVATYSRGMRQRLGLAEIVMKDARVAILDEPTSGLDPQSTEEFLDLIRSLKEDGVTVLLSSHLLDHMQRICDRVALFRRGRIALMGSVPELARQVLGTGFAVDVQAQGPDLSAQLGQVRGVHSVRTLGPGHYRLLAEDDVRAEAARAVVQAGGDLHRLSVDLPSLDAIYNRFFQDADTKEADHAQT
ncbi:MULTISPECIES: ABC transporter ATP-binding protein [Bordetella]|uniref:ABC transporter ATP-binding protein n=2 Tax=Bordetella TaxID=517 RepID=A0A261W842_9BORD|nr:MULTISPECIES: ABC transporter ATP-binding protein [Bordetella]MDM9558407.1 ABC transporter ATP-binding protein [Bordetella petrii]OZI82528.1 ABC transporter ATP-binding protein [Bordetella genomosp. 2]